MNTNNFLNVESLSRQVTSSNLCSYIAGQSVVIQQIPTEIILTIFSTLSVADLLPLRVVEKRWKILIDQSLESINRSISSKEITLYGKFKNGKLDGQGKATLANGAIFEGEFKDNRLNGQGKITHADGTILEGKFKDDQLNGKGKITKTGKIVEGEFKDDRLNGKGTITDDDGTIFEGEFKGIKLNGQGKMIFSNGVILEGEFKDNLLNGKGKVTHADGTILEGKFKGGALIQGKRKRADGVIEEEVNLKRANRRA